MFRLAPLFVLALLAGCGSGDSGPGGVTRGEQKALDDAAAMIEKQQLDPSALPSAPVPSYAPSTPAKAGASGG